MISIKLFKVVANVGNPPLCRGVIAVLQSSFIHYLNFGAFENPPTPKEFSYRSCGESDIFWNYTLIINQFRLVQTRHQIRYVLASISNTSNAKMSQREQRSQPPTDCMVDNINLPQSSKLFLWYHFFKNALPVSRLHNEF